jgi:hypothetical protein
MIRSGVTSFVDFPATAFDMMMFSFFQSILNRRATMIQRQPSISPPRRREHPHTQASATRNVPAEAKSRP